MALAVGMAQAQTPLLPEGKKIYIPKDLRDNDFTQKDSKWSYAHAAWTDDVMLFWENGFGDDVATAPDLDGHNMKVDIPNLLRRIESFYQFYRDSLEFVLPGSKSEEYRMMVMLNYSLEGTAYGGDYDNVIGALWVAPNRVQDEKMNCIAHELGHSFQIQNACDGNSQGLGGGIFEMCSQWMLWQVNPEWVKDENYHWQDFRKLFHKRFLAGENIYHSPYVLEYWSMKRGRTVMGRLFREGRGDEDVAQSYMRMFNVSSAQMGDEMYDCYSRLVTFDFPRVKTVCKPYACQLATPTSRETRGRKTVIKPEEAFVPETYGFNVIELPLDGRTVDFQGLGTKGKDGYRYGIVLVDKQKNPTYLPMSAAFSGKLKYKAEADTEHAYLVVVGCPDSYPTAENTIFPYQITVK